MNRRTGTFDEFKDYTLAIARGDRRVEPGEPRIWSETEASHAAVEPVLPAPIVLKNSDYLHSVLRERIVEHLFIGEALRRLWSRGIKEVEVLRSEFDAGGYDLVMSCGKILRHIQFKSTTEDGKANSVNVNLKLTEKPSGCVIWIVVSPEKLEFKAYRWLGSSPGEPLPPDIIDMKLVKQPKYDAKGIKREKHGHRVVPRQRFDLLPDMDAVLDRLFGKLP